MQQSADSITQAPGTCATCCLKQVGACQTHLRKQVGDAQHTVGDELQQCVQQGLSSVSPPALL
jgi:hypothetical protein